MNHLAAYSVYIASAATLCTRNVGENCHRSGADDRTSLSCPADGAVARSNPQAAPSSKFGLDKLRFRRMLPPAR